MVQTDRIRRQQQLREVEGYLELVTLFSERWPLRPEVRDCVAQRALDVVAKLEETAGQRGDLLFMKGQALRAMERHAEAVVPLQQAAQLDPDAVAVRLALGWCYKRSGRLDKAIESLEAALAADPSEAILYYNLACYYSLARKKKLALDHLSRALSMDAHYRERIDDESDFDALRDDPDFQTLLNRVTV